MRAISISTIDKYRRNAIHDSKIPNDVLKIKLNCLIDAVKEEHISTRGNSKVYQFGSCLLYVSDDIITDIRWTHEKRYPTKDETQRMTTLFLSNGLNKKGTKFEKDKQ